MNRRVIAREWLWFVCSCVVAGVASASYTAYSISTTAKSLDPFVALGAKPVGSVARIISYNPDRGTVTYGRIVGYLSDGMPVYEELVGWDVNGVPLYKTAQPKIVGYDPDSGRAIVGSDANRGTPEYIYAANPREPIFDPSKPFQIVSSEPLKTKTPQGTSWEWDGQTHKFPAQASDVQMAEALSLELVGYDESGTPRFGKFFGSSAELNKRLGDHPIGTGYLKTAREIAVKNAAARDAQLTERRPFVARMREFAASFVRSAVFLGPLLYLGLGLGRITWASVRLIRQET